MNQVIMDNNIKPVSTPQEAISQFMGEQYMEWLMDYISNTVKSWNSLKVISQAKPKPEKLKKFMMQRYLAAEAFAGGKEGDPGFLGFAIANLSEAPDPAAESALELLEKKRKEEILGASSGAEQGSSQHKDLWMKLLNAVGLSDEEIKRAEPKEPTRNYIAELSDVYSTAEWQTTMAAFAAHERIVPDEYGAILSMLQNNLALTAQDTEILTWHTKADAKYVIETNHILEQVAVDEEGKHLIFDGVQRQLEARAPFYEALAKYLQE